jgi:hypothetical protein
LTFNRTRVPRHTDECTATDGLIAHRMPQAPVYGIAGVIDLGRPAQLGSWMDGQETNHRSVRA